MGRGEICKSKENTLDFERKHKQVSTPKPKETGPNKALGWKKKRTGAAPEQNWGRTSATESVYLKRNALETKESTASRGKNSDAGLLKAKTEEKKGSPATLQTEQHRTGSNPRTLRTDAQGYKKHTIVF